MRTKDKDKPCWDGMINKAAREAAHNYNTVAKKLKKTSFQDLQHLYVPPSSPVTAKIKKTIQAQASQQGTPDTSEIQPAR